MRALALAAYGTVCYGASMAALVVLFAWLGGLAGLPIPPLDEGTGAVSAAALIWNSLVMLGFALYHSLFARTFVKRWTRALVSRNLERVTYNLVSAVLSVLLCLLWWPIPARLWGVSSPELRLAIQGVYVGLWIVHMTSIVLMNHNDFFGLRQVGLAMRGEAYRPLPPVTRGYYLGTRLALVVSLALIPWASPVMSVGRLQLCVFMTLYTALGAWLSNRDQGDVMGAAPALAPAAGKMIA